MKLTKMMMTAPAVFAMLINMNAQAQQFKPMDMPKPPPPVKQALPMGAQPTDKGVYIPTNKSGNVGVSLEGLKNPAPGEAGGSASITIKTP
jgi:hypothetical protein